MRSIIRATRLIAVAALVITVAIGFGSPAGAVSTGSVVNNGAGGVTITYTADQGDGISILVYSSSSTCSVGFPPQPLYFLNTSSPQAPILGPSPFTLDGTTTVRQGGPNTTIPTGSYQFCLYAEAGGTFTFLSSVQTTIGTVTPTTTSPSSSTSTSTAPAADPVAPAFTG